MKKQLFFLSLIFVFLSHGLHAMQDAVAALQNSLNPQALEAELQKKVAARAQVRKALYMRCGVTATMVITAVACSIALLKNSNLALFAEPIKALPPPPPPPRSFFSWRSTPPVVAPPAIIQMTPQHDFGVAKLVGLVGSAFGALKNIGPCWQQIMQFGSLKRDTNALLVLQKETRDGQKQMNIAQEVMKEMLKEKDTQDAMRWKAQQKTLDALHKKMDNLKEELKALLESKSEEATQQIALLQMNICELTAQITLLVQQLSPQTKAPPYA